MKLSLEIYTSELEESKEFYCKYFNFRVKYEIENFFILQHKVDSSHELLFCFPGLAFVNPIFHPEFKGTKRSGIIIQMEVLDVEYEYQRLKSLNLPFVLDLVNEEVNGKHFTVIDPNGIYIDIVEYD